MRKTLLTFLAIAFCSTLSAQQTITSENIDPFTSVTFSGNLQVTLCKSDRNSIDIKLYDADIKYFKWSVNNNELTASLRPLQIGKAHAEIIVNYSDTLRLITLNSTELTITDTLTSNILEISVNGGGKLKGVVEVADLDLQVTGNSVAELSGAAKYVMLRATEKSKADTRKMECVSMYVEAATGAEAYVNVYERIIANAKSSSTIFYLGEPSIMKDLSSKFSSTVGSSVIKIY